MNQVKPSVIYDRRKARQAKMNNGMYSNSSLNSSGVFDANASETNIPLTAQKNQFGYGAGQGKPYPFSSDYQRSSSGNIVYAPKPQHRYSPENQYNSEELVGHVAPGGASSPSYNYTPTRQTSDEVGFNPAGRVPNHQSSPQIPNLPRTQSPEIIPSPSQAIPSSSSYPQPQSSSYPFQTPASHYPNSMPTSPNPYTPHSYQPQVVQTPTQAQFVSYSSTGAPDRLPSPGYPNPSSPVVTGMHSPVVLTTPHAYTSHAYEPTDATYHTAMASSDSAGFPDDGYHPHQPPSYRS